MYNVMQFQFTYRGTWIAFHCQSWPLLVTSGGETAQKGWGKPWACVRPWCWLPAGPRGDHPRHQCSQCSRPVCVCVFVYVCVCVWACVCVHVCMCMYISKESVHCYVHTQIVQLNVFTNMIPTCTWIHAHTLASVPSVCTYIYHLDVSVHPTLVCTINLYTKLAAGYLKWLHVQLFAQPLPQLRQTDRLRVYWLMMDSLNLSVRYPHAGMPQVVTVLWSDHQGELQVPISLIRDDTKLIKDLV